MQPVRQQAAAAGVAFDDEFIDLLSDSEEVGEGAAPAGRRQKGASGAKSGGGGGEGGRARPSAGGGPLYKIMWHRWAGAAAAGQGRGLG